MFLSLRKKPAPKGQRSPRGVSTRERRGEVRLAEGRGLSSEETTGYRRGLRWYSCDLSQGSNPGRNRQPLGTSRRTCSCKQVGQKDRHAREYDGAFHRSRCGVAGAHRRSHRRNVAWLTPAITHRDTKIRMDFVQSLMRWPALVRCRCRRMSAQPHALRQQQSGGALRRAELPAGPIRNG
jgi:hypothetical protein